MDNYERLQIKDIVIMKDRNKKEFKNKNNQRIDISFVMLISNCYYSIIDDYVTTIYARYGLG